MPQDKVAQFLVPPPTDEFDVELAGLDELLEAAQAKAEVMRSGGGEVVADESDCEGCKI